jgi:hypothetical protein
METPEVQETRQETTIARKSALPYVIGVVLIIALGAAAFIGVRYFNGPKTSNMGGPGKNEVSISGPGGEKTYSLDIEPAKELPSTQPEVNGLFVERKDKSIFVGTGDVTVRMQAKPGESPQADASFSGPKVEVVISANTIVYHETTQLDPENPETKVQQTVELSTIDEITEQSSITVWGRKAGDRVIADVVMFSTPFMIRAPEAAGP